MNEAEPSSGFGDGMASLLRITAGSFVGSIIALALIAFLMAISGKVHASVQIPDVSAGYRLQLQRAAGAEFGLDAPVARLAAQIHQESRWRPDAASKFAQGLAQFTPSTAAWLPEVCPQLGGFDRWDPGQAIRGLACYDAWLYRRVKPIGNTPLSECTRWHFTLRAYNGGEGWLARERRLALTANQVPKADPNDWSQVARFRARATWALRENLGYPQRIIYTVEPRYVAAGWPAGKQACA